MDENTKRMNVVKSRAIDALAEMDAKEIETIIILIDQKKGDKHNLNVAFAGDTDNLIVCCGEFLRALAGQINDDNAVRH